MVNRSSKALQCPGRHGMPIYLKQTIYIYTSAENSTKIFLPVSTEQFATISNIAHVMKNALLITELVIPGQTGLIAFDQPPYTIARSLQMIYPLLFRRRRVFIDFGALHIEMNFQLILGKLLKDSGWTYLLRQANICSPDSCLGHTNAMKTRNSHTISACALSMLQVDSFMETRDGGPFSLEEFLIWCTAQLKYPNF